MSSRAADTASLLSHQTSSSGATRSIYPRGPAFNASTFASKDFIVKDFVESLANGAGPSPRRSGPYEKTFDPKSYIRTFEHALTRLGGLSEEKEVLENELAGEVRRKEGQHKQHCATLQRKLDQTLDSFNSLEDRLDAPTNGYGQVTEVSGTVALRIGEKLEELDRQKKRAEAAQDLIVYWQDISERGDLSRLENVRSLGGSDGKVRCARIARQILRICEDLGSATLASSGTGSKQNGVHQHEQIDSTEQERYRETGELVERFLERLETDLLDQFDDCQRHHNENGMRECATALYDFRGGASVTARYVNGHEFFLDRSHMVTEEVSGDRELWDHLADPDFQTTGAEAGLQSLVDEVKLVLQEESFTIKQVFPFHEQVLVTFLQRIFQQSIQQRLEVVLEKAASISALALLRTLQAARNYIGAAVEDLKAHGLTEHPDAVSQSVATVLDQQLEVLFIPYLAGSSYIDREKQSLQELYASLLYRFTLYHSKRRKTPTSYLGTLGQRGRELLSNARDSVTERLESSELSASQKSTLLRVASIRDSDSKNKTDIEVSEYDGALSVPVVKRMLRWLAEAVGRGLELGGGSETPRDLSIIQKLLLANVGDLYLDTALDAANEIAVAQETSKTEPDLSFMPGLRAAINILQLVLTITNSVLLPLASGNVTVRREMEKSVASLVHHIEGKISLIQTRTIDISLNWVSKLLSRQNRTDFRPRDDAIGIEQLQTATCTYIFAFLSRVRDLCAQSLEGENFEAFSTELAIGFRSLLFEHFKKFQINLAGGLMVSKDITKYIEFLRSLPLAGSFKPSLEVLIEVGHMFVIGSEALKDRLRGGSTLTGVDKADLRPYILRRDDVNSIGVQAVLNSL